MPSLLTVDAVDVFLGGIDPADIDTLTDVVNDVEALFHAQCNRVGAPFGDGQEDVVETHDGTGRCTLYLRYPVAELTEVLLGMNPDDPVETLDVDDRGVLLWNVGERRLDRVDGGVFGWFGQPRYVRVTYDASDSRPEDARIAIKSVVAEIWNRRGSEGTSAERVAGYSADYVRIAEANPLWTAAVTDCRDIPV